MLINLFYFCFKNLIACFEKLLTNNNLIIDKIKLIYDINEKLKDKVIFPKFFRELLCG